MRREEKFTDQKLLKISSLQTDYLNIDSSSGFSRTSERAHAVQTKCTVCGGNNHSAEKYFKIIRKEKEKSRAVYVTSNRQKECTPRKCFRFGSEDHIIAKCPNPKNNNEKRQKKVRFNEKANRACNNRKNYDDQKIYASMARMYGDSSQLTNCILDSGAMCHMMPEVSDFIPGSLEDTDKYIEVADGHRVTAKQKGQV